jgi:hypothetical protein
MYGALGLGGVNPAYLRPRLFQRDHRPDFNQVMLERTDADCYSLPSIAKVMAAAAAMVA